MICQDSISGSWRIFHNGLDLAILEHKANESLAVLLHGNCSLKWPVKEANCGLYLNKCTEKYSVENVILVCLIGELLNQNTAYHIIKFLNNNENI